MKHITSFSSVAQAEACPGLYTPQVCMVEGQSGGLVFAKNSGVEGETITINVDPESGKVVPVYPVPEDFVDFGLPSGTLWSTKNIGATNGDTSISWFGNYYAWGETETKSYYDWEDPEDATQNYKHANGSYDTLTKYCNDSDYGYEGYTDELTQLVPSDDVATKNNSAWRMPTKEDFEELIVGTSSSWVEDYNDVEGLNGKVFMKATITRPAFKNITLYTMFDENFNPVEIPTEITAGMQAELSIYTKDEMDQIVSHKTGGQVTDFTTIVFKDQLGTLAEYNIDYGFVEKEADPSVSMFIPAAGSRYGSDIYDVGSRCLLQSSSLYLGNPANAYGLSFYSDSIFMYYGHRNCGLAVRPVC